MKASVKTWRRAASSICRQVGVDFAKETKANRIREARCRYERLCCHIEEHCRRKWRPANASENDEDSIRLLEILAGPKYSPIRTKLHLRRLSSQVCFEAISYTWGNDKDRVTIIVDAQPVKIRRNLWKFLSVLRKSDEARLVWVDALCIYLDRYRTKCRRNLRFEPLFCEGVGFAYLACPAHTYELVWAPQSWSSTLRSLFVVLSQFQAAYGTRTAAATRRSRDMGFAAKLPLQS
jgi:hypothetical protein